MGAGQGRPRPRGESPLGPRPLGPQPQGHVHGATPTAGKALDRKGPPDLLTPRLRVAKRPDVPSCHPHPPHTWNCKSDEAVSVSPRERVGTATRLSRVVFRPRPSLPGCAGSRAGRRSSVPAPRLPRALRLDIRPDFPTFARPGGRLGDPALTAKGCTPTGGVSTAPPHPPPHPRNASGL